MLRWCLWLTLAAGITAAFPNSSNATTASASSTHADSRAFAFTQCTMITEGCTCNVDHLPPIYTPLAWECLWDATSCQCGWMDGQFSIDPNLPAIAADKTCVLDTDLCKCLAGTAMTRPTPEATAVDVDALAASIEQQLVGIALVVQSLQPIGRQMALQPVGALAALSSERREKLVAEQLAAIGRLGAFASDRAAFAHVARADGLVVAARLRGVAEYLVRLRDEPLFLAAQLVEAHAMAQWLGGLVDDMEKARRRVV